MGEQELKQENDGDCLRCVKCKKVLAKGFEDGHFAIKCPRCNTINMIAKNDAE